jgi:carbon monoxide dehydrogenase subunit G
MKIELSGNVTANAPIDSVRRFSSSFPDIASCIPSATDYNKVDDRSFRVKITMNIALIKGTFAVKATMIEDLPNKVSYRMEGRGVGSAMNQLLTLEFLDRGGEVTDVHWSLDSDFGGIVSGIASPVLKSIVEDVVNKTIANVKAKVEVRQG